MLSKSWRFVALSILCLVPAAFPAPFGKVVDIGGHASDVALDERRGVVYVANYTADEIAVISTANGLVQRTINVMAQPAALSLSPDGRYLVVAHYRSPLSAGGLTVVDLDANQQRRQTSGWPPLAVAFGADNRAIVLTTHDVRLLDPVSGTTTVLTPYASLVEQVLAPKDLPVEFATFPPEIIRASLGASPEGNIIRGIADVTESAVLYVSYDVTSRQLKLLGYSTSPALGPRVASVGSNGALQLMGWALLNERGVLMAQFPSALGKLNLGSHAIDLSRGLVYAQIPEAVQTAQTTTPPATGQTAPVQQLGAPVLQILDADNLTVRERLQLPENLAGRSVLSADGNVMYAVSDSGLTILPVGLLSKYPRVVASQEDLLFRGNYCDRRTASQEIEIVDPGGNNTPFSLRASIPGVTISPDSGVTPAKIRVSVDTSALSSRTGTLAGLIEIRSSLAVNIPDPVRVLVNNREPDQRGSFFNVPGKLVDIASDPARDRFYVLRQDKNRVLVFNGTTFQQIASLRTGNTPWQMAVTLDGKYLIVTNDNSQIANVYDLDTLQQTQSVEFPFGHYPRSIAVSGSAILVASRVVGASAAGCTHGVDSLDLGSRAAVRLDTLGIYKNCVNLDTALAASPAAETIFFAQADGTTLVYRSSNRTFAASRKDFAGLSGAYGAPSDDRFIVDSNVLNRSLVQIGKLDEGLGTTSGLTAADGFALRTASPTAAGAGTIERIELGSGQTWRSVRVSESPVVATKVERSFLRTLVPLSNRRNIVSLTTSGFTALSWNYDAAVAIPVIEGVVSAADGSKQVAPGGLIRVYGSDLSPDTAASREVPLTALLGNSCLTVNGIPVPVERVSPGEIVGQLPFEVAGDGAMVLKSPGGVSNTYSFRVQLAAPTVFRDGVAGSETGIATVVRARNGELVTFSNPVHAGDDLVIYLTGMGRTTPDVRTGYPGPKDPLAHAALPPDVTLGAAGLPVAFAGMTPGEVGVYQINASVPWWTPSGKDVPLTVTQAGVATTLLVRVVN